MTKDEAINIINDVRFSNPFTMGLDIEQYIKQFIKRYALINGVIIPNNVIEVAKVIKTLK